MNADRWRQIETLFHAAREREPAERGPFLDEACAGDEELRREIDSLLAEHDRGAISLENAASDLAVEWSGRTLGMLESGATLGKYRIERPLGQGGMGTVFLAYDAVLQRRLAIKY
jgi:serine/threonine-protein kinase